MIGKYLLRKSDFRDDTAHGHAMDLGTNDPFALSVAVFEVKTQCVYFEVTYPRRGPSVHRTGCSTFWNNVDGYKQTETELKKRDERDKRVFRGPCPHSARETIFRTSTIRENIEVIATDIVRHLWGLHKQGDGSEERSCWISEFSISLISCRTWGGGNNVVVLSEIAF